MFLTDLGADVERLAVLGDGVGDVVVEPHQIAQSHVDLSSSQQKVSDKTKNIQVFKP